MLSFKFKSNKFARSKGIRINAEAKKRVFDVVNELRWDIRESFKEPKSGKNYMIAGEPHKASAPGEPPATLSINQHHAIAPGVESLWSSIRVGEVEYTSDGVVGSIYTDNPYAIALEFGTLKIAARPFMRPALYDQTWIDHVFQSKWNI